TASTTRRPSTSTAAASTSIRSQRREPRHHNPWGLPTKNPEAAFFYYPYNRGKTKVDTVFGNHVGDWEHITIRLTWQKVWSKWILAPSMSSDQPSLFLAAHDEGAKETWPVPWVPGTHHPIIYSALGSHGSYRDPGSHLYKDHWLAGEFRDHTNRGTAWDTWKKLECFDYDARRGLGPTWKGTWPRWLEHDTGNRNTGSNDPASGPVGRWGNRAWDKWFGYYRLDQGPKGPADKPYWETQALD
ncbi:MAG: DUF946 domain-containing protein, partial [Planctomycetes bacterium]|nr:DUF946 domain-containing protein [Planctomycetota bacterium]